MTIVGTYESTNLAPARDELIGECSRATHVIAALTVGAFEFFAGRASRAGAKASVLGAGAHVAHDQAHETLSRDGQVASCGPSQRGDLEPPQNCGALLRLELTDVRAAGAGMPTCEAGTRLVGRECKPIEKPAELAPEDVGFVDDQGGAGWGNRCYNHYKNGALKFARAACQKGLEAGPAPKVGGAILYNAGLVDEAAGDVKAACEFYRRSLAVRPGVAAVRKKLDGLGCAALLAQ